MAQLQCQMQPANKEPQPEWSSICNNVFDQYLDSTDPFDFSALPLERSSSNSSSALFDFSGPGSEQSNFTSGTSPIAAWGESVVQSIEAPDGQAPRQQPTAKEPVDFWTRTLKSLEQNAAETEKKQHQQVLRTTKSHPDFLSLGGHPSPPAVPSSPTPQPLSVQRSRHRNPTSTTTGTIARNASRQPSNAVRSVSRGRPIGVAKNGAGSSSNRSTKASLSPTKMMTPSRYRAASRTPFRDVWAQRVVSGMDKHYIRMPDMLPSQTGLPVSPPLSGHQHQGMDDFGTFESPERGYAGGYDDQMSPLTVHFQQARLHTPASPMLSPGTVADNGGYFEQVGVPQIPPNPYQPQTVPLNDTAPLFPERTSSLAPNRLQAFDFGFLNSNNEMDAWGAASAPFVEPNYHSDLFSHQRDPFVGAENPMDGSPDFDNASLGISCDPALVSNYTAVTHNTSMPTNMYQPQQPVMASYSLPTQMRVSKTEPNTPHRRQGRSKSCVGSPSLSPTPTTAPRSSRQRSSSRRAVSRHRRVKSTTATPRAQQGAGSSSHQGGFVNFTPSDSGKILNGVAPSGSSKTKARREKEAADRRRRFSQAATKAVLELGGDIDSLERAGLLGQ